MNDPAVIASTTWNSILVTYGILGFVQSKMTWTRTGIGPKPNGKAPSWDLLALLRLRQALVEAPETSREANASATPSEHSCLRSKSTMGINHGFYITSLVLAVAVLGNVSGSSEWLVPSQSGSSFRNRGI